MCKRIEKGGQNDTLFMAKTPFILVKVCECVQSIIYNKYNANAKQIIVIIIHLIIILFKFSLV